MRLILICLTIMILSKVQAQQNGLTQNKDTIVLGDSIQLYFGLHLQPGTSISQNGCGDFISFRDSVFPNTIKIDLSFHYPGPYSQASTCFRRDTFKLKNLRAGNYNLIGFWTATDSSFTPTLVYYRNFSDTIQLTVLNPTSITENERSPFKISPNPVLNYLNLDYSSTTHILKIEFFDLAGKLVHEEFNPNHEVDLSQLTKGIYLANINTKNGNYQMKVVKE